VLNHSIGTSAYNIRKLHIASHGHDCANDWWYQSGLGLRNILHDS